MDSDRRSAASHALTRSRLLRIAITIGVLAFAVHVLLPQIGEVGDALEALRTGRWHYLALAAAGVVFWIPATRRRILKDLTGMIRAVPSVLGDPRRSLIMVVSAVAGNVAFGVALLGSVAAYGPVPSPLVILVAYMFAATAGAISPTPGGLGAMEAALIAALTRLGVSAGPAVAAALTFRLVTFWAPLPVGGWALRRGRKNGWL